VIGSAQPPARGGDHAGRIGGHQSTLPS
jgi:hypothetical protein